MDNLIPDVEVVLTPLQHKITNRITRTKLLLDFLIFQYSLQLMKVLLTLFLLAAGFRLTTQRVVGHDRREGNFQAIRRTQPSFNKQVQSFQIKTEINGHLQILSR